MNLQKAFVFSIALAVLGSVSFYLFRDLSEAVWFAFGSAAGLLNFALICLLVQRGLRDWKRKGLFLSFLLLKTFGFLSLLVVCLIVLKPALLPFTSGVTIVIVGSSLGALWEARRGIFRK